MIHGTKSFMLASMLLLLSSPLCAQSPLKDTDDTGELTVTNSRVSWPRPEEVLADLRSANDDTRLHAMYLIGVSDKEAHRNVWAQTSPTKILGQKVVTPDQIQLKYAVLGTDETKAAVLAVQAEQMMYAAVALPYKNGWERIALLNCWCKYELGTSHDALDDFVQVVPAPDSRPDTAARYELVLRASGGGSGIYVQDEGHYRILGG